MPSPSLAQPLASQVEDLIHRHAVSIAASMPIIVGDAQNEEGIRQASAELVNRFLKEAQIKVKPLHEYGLAGGRIDTKYGGVIIEYKNPHTQDQIGLKLESHGTKQIIKQIKERFDDFASEENLSHNRIFACGLDGRNIIYLRHRGKEFEVENPQPITPLTFERLLRALVSLGARENRSLQKA